MDGVAVGRLGAARGFARRRDDDARVLAKVADGDPAGSYDLTTAEGRQGVKSVLGYLPQDLGLYPDLTARQSGQARR